MLHQSWEPQPHLLKLDLQVDLKVYAAMTATMRIAEVASRSGFSAATLRYYEQLELLPAPRTAAGYRAYDEGVLTRLAFISRAKALGGTGAGDVHARLRRDAGGTERVARPRVARRRPGGDRRGTRLDLDATTPLDRLALLVEAEQRCCSFFAFAITVDSRGVALAVRAPPDGLAMVDSLLAGGPQPRRTPVERQGDDLMRLS